MDATRMEKLDALDAAAEARGFRRIPSRVGQLRNAAGRVEDVLQIMWGSKPTPQFPPGGWKKVAFNADTIDAMTLAKCVEFFNMELDVMHVPKAKGSR